MKPFTPNATIRTNGKSIPAWEDGQPVYASSYQTPINKGVDGIRPETYLVEAENGIKQRISVRNVEIKKINSKMENKFYDAGNWKVSPSPTHRNSQGNAWVKLIINQPPHNSRIMTEVYGETKEQVESNAQLICDAVNGTAGIGVNPNSVKEMKEALENIKKHWDFGNFSRNEKLWKAMNEALKNSAL